MGGRVRSLCPTLGHGPRWLKPPTSRSADGGGEHRQATWLELFFDLVFVVAVAELSGLLLEDVTVGTWARVNVLFLPPWWLWMDYSYYGDQFDADVVYRLSPLAALFPVVVLSRTMGHAL